MRKRQRRNALKPKSKPSAKLSKRLRESGLKRRKRLREYESNKKKKKRDLGLKPKRKSAKG